MPTRVAVAVSPSTRRHRGRVFCPTDIGGCKLWLPDNPAAMTFNGANVVTWWDQSGSGRHVTQGVAANQPTYLATGGPTGGPTVRFGLLWQEYLQGVWAQAQPLHSFIVALPSRSGINNRIIWDGTTFNNVRLITAPTAADLSIDIPSGGSSAVTVAHTAAAFRRIEALYSGAGSSLTTDEAANTGALPATASDGLTLGMGGNGVNNSADCDIAEVIQYNAPVTGADLTALRAYFAAKYGL